MIPIVWSSIYYTLPSCSEMYRHTSKYSVHYFHFLYRELIEMVDKWYYSRAAPKVMPPVLWWWPAVSEENVDDMAVETELSQQYSYFVDMWQMAAEGQSDRMASDMEVHVKQKCVVEFRHLEKIVPIDIHWCLLNFYRDQSVHVSTVRRWVVCFSSDSGSLPLV